METSASELSAERTWMNVAASNLAHAKTTQPVGGGPCRRSLVMRPSGKAHTGRVWPLRPAALAADLEGAVAALARREPAARGAASEPVLGGSRPPRIGAFRTRRAVILGNDAADPTHAPGTSRPHAAGQDAPVSALLAAAIARAAGSRRSAAGGIRRPTAPPSTPGAIPAAPATALTPLEQAVHDHVEQSSGGRRPRES